MRKRGSRPLKELYSLTTQIEVPEITPVLEGSCRIQGPVDEPGNRLPKTNSSMFTTENKCAFKNENLLPRIESGTCNTCSAPCSSCMHSSRTASFMESNIDCPLPCNTLGRKRDDHCSSIEVEGLPLYKSQTCHNNQHAASETSNLLSTTSSHDPYFENADSKATGRNSVYEASDAVDMPPRASSFTEYGNNFTTKMNATAGSLSGSRSNMIIGCQTSSSQNKEHLGPENQGDTISCISAVRDVHIADTDCNMEVDKKDVRCASKPRSSLLGNGFKDKVEVSATSSSGPSAAPDSADLPHEDIFFKCSIIAIQFGKRYFLSSQ